MPKFDRLDPFFVCPPENPLWERCPGSKSYRAEDEDTLWYFNPDTDEYTAHTPHDQRWDDEWDD